MRIDVRRAYFYAPVQRPVFIEIPAEDRMPGDEDMVGELDFSLYGTRDAAQNWESAYSTFMEGIGFAKGRASPCIFRHSKRDLRVVVHGDDFTILGYEEDLDWFREHITRRFEVKIRGRKWKSYKMIFNFLISFILISKCTTKK